MVETNNAEERLVRIERMVEALQHESAAIKRVAAEVLEVVVRASPSLSDPTTPKAGR